MTLNVGTQVNYKSVNCQKGLPTKSLIPKVYILWKQKKGKKDNYHSNKQQSRV